MKKDEKRAAALVMRLLNEEPTKTLMERLKLHDEYTYRHSINVAIYTCMLVHEADLYLKKETVLGALLHDIGKLDIPSTVLRKPTALTEGEIKLLRHHPMYSYQILDDKGYPSFIKEIGLLHHEKIDGSGYPSGIKVMNDNIQVVSICDMYDAMTTSRPYHHKYSHNKAFNTLMEDAINGKLNKHYISYLTNHSGRDSDIYLKDNEMEVCTITFTDARQVFDFIVLCEKQNFDVHICYEADVANAKSLISVCRLTKFSNLHITTSLIDEDTKKKFVNKIKSIVKDKPQTTINYARSTIGNVMYADK